MKTPSYEFSSDISLRWILHYFFNECEISETKSFPNFKACLKTNKFLEFIHWIIFAEKLHDCQNVFPSMLVIVTWFNVLCLILFCLSSFTAQEVRKGGLADEKINTRNTLSHTPLTSYLSKHFSTYGLWLFPLFISAVQA